MEEKSGRKQNKSQSMYEAMAMAKGGRMPSMDILLGLATIRPEPEGLDEALAPKDLSQPVTIELSRGEILMLDTLLQKEMNSMTRDDEMPVIIRLLMMQDIIRFLGKLPRKG